MSNIPAELKYRASHEWLRYADDGSVTVGITEHAQQLLGDMVFVDLPATGAQLTCGQECAVAESVKAASDIYAPLDGEVIAVNPALAEHPELVNSDPYGEGWLFKLTPSGGEQGLLDAAAYQASVDE